MKAYLYIIDKNRYSKLHMSFTIKECGISINSQLHVYAKTRKYNGYYNSGFYYFDSGEKLDCDLIIK